MKGCRILSHKKLDAIIYSVSLAILLIIFTSLRPTQNIFLAMFSN